MKMLVRGISSLYIMGEALPVCFGFEKGCWIKPLHKVNRKRLNFIDHPWTVMLSMAVFCVHRSGDVFSNMILLKARGHTKCHSGIADFFFAEQGKLNFGASQFFDSGYAPGEFI